ncbi:MAG TPA: DinB family protein [Terracidiphilus sp.]|nr:DinB family protein [Terracidiphilus sp.]
MFTIDGVRKFHSWTHASLTLLLDHLSTIPTADYAREISGFGFPALQKQVIHIFNCEGFWIHTLQGLNYVDRTPVEFPTVADARILQQEVSRRTEAYLTGLTDQQLNSDTELHFPDGDTAVRTPALILHHLLTHAFHHKGQIVAMCRGLGHPAPDTDLNQFE